MLTSQLIDKEPFLTLPEYYPVTQLHDFWFNSMLLLYYSIFCFLNIG